MKQSTYSSTKKGVASLYVVIFATILFGVITLSFIRIILSESTQTSNDDLSQSAYDSALAGVEDAKIAVNRYYQCMSSAGGNPDSCRFGDLFGGDCDNFKLKGYLGYDYDGEVLIQESSGSASSNSNNSDQAYTCVILSNIVSDYRSTLTSDTRTRVVPLGIGANDLHKVKYIEFKWYSEINGTEFKNLNHNGALADNNHSTTPPTISLTLLKTPASFNLESFNNSTSPDYSTMILLPSEETDSAATNALSQNEISSAGNSDKSANGVPIANNPYRVKCTHSEFACTLTLGTSTSQLNFASGGNAMLVVSLPYGDTVTDFAVTLRDGEGKVIPFENVQVSVDSTGRANQLLRRVETRLDPADIFFPYPQYEVELHGDNEDSLLKYYWITANCWTDLGYCRNNGSLE